MDEFNFKPAQYCINKIFELTDELDSTQFYYHHYSKL